MDPHPLPARALVIALLAACDGGSTPPPVLRQVADVSLAPATKLDVVILMDNSVGLPGAQLAFANAYPAFRDALVPRPDLHVAIATSDMGTSSSDEPPAPAVGQVGIGGCAGTGDDGALKATLSDPFSSDDFAFAVKVGGGGCGFEQHLRALDRALTRPDNAPMLRADAALAVIIVADEDDCSAAHARLFDPGATELGALQSFRCTTEGVTCNEPIDVVGPKTGCHARTDDTTVRGIEPTIDLLESLRPRERFAIAGILGPLDPFDVELRAPPSGGAAIPWLGDSCPPSPPAPVTGAANPGVRIGEVIDHFEAHGTYGSVCPSSYAPQLVEAARVFEQLLGVGCVDTATLGPHCEAQLDGETVAMCPASGPCVDLVPDPVACPQGPTFARVELTGATGDRLTLACDRPE